ncbi:hypothetical protein AB9C87_15110 [Klebsiella pneumoniae]|uniref:hypothetical protein n=2 Tax=Klebsiella pneumoniae TaxID=573 RepID=UPI002FE0BE40
MMKKNTGRLYNIYKENKAVLDTSAPVVLSIIGMITGFYVKKKLTELNLDEAVSSATMAALIALPVAVYNKLTVTYAAKIQEDKDFEELNDTNEKLKLERKKTARFSRALSKLKQEKIKTYNAHDKLSRDIKSYLNGDKIEPDVRTAICKMLDDGNGDIFELTISVDIVIINEMDSHEIEEDESDTVYGKQTNSSGIPIN